MLTVYVVKNFVKSHYIHVYNNHQTSHHLLNSIFSKKNTETTSIIYASVEIQSRKASHSSWKDSNVHGQVERDSVHEAVHFLSIWSEHPHGVAPAGANDDVPLLVHVDSRRASESPVAGGWQHRQSVESPPNQVQAEDAVKVEVRNVQQVT